MVFKTIQFLALVAMFAPLINTQDYDYEGPDLDLIDPFNLIDYGIESAFESDNGFMPGYRIIAGEIIEELTVDDFAECFANCLLKKTTARTAGSGCGAWNFDPENKKCSLLRPTPSCCSPLENRRQSSSMLSGYICPPRCFLNCPPELVCEVDSISNETFCYDLPPENDFACTTYGVPPIVNNPTVSTIIITWGLTF